MSQPGYQRVQIEFHCRTLTVETGRMAKQAGGAALVQLGESVVLVTATALASAREGIDFFPLTCDYQEKTFAAGKIPGGFFKREGRPAEKEILTSRLIDRPLRPLFPKGFNCETQVIATVLSHDKENDPDVLSLLGASTALVLSDIPWNGPIAAVRIGRLGGRFVINPTTSQLATSDMNVIVAGSRDAIVMVEGGAHMVPEAVLLEALFAAHEALQPLIALQESLQRLVGKPKRSVTAPAVDPALERRVREAALPSLRAALAKPGKQERYDALDQARDEVVGRLGEGTPERVKQVAAFFDHLKKDVVREAIVQQKRRLDGRGLADVRPITCEVEVLPRTHGSAPPPTSRRSMPSSARRTRSSCCTTTSRPSARARSSSCAAPGGARSATGRSPSARSRRSSRARRSSPTPSASSRRSSSQTAPRLWPPCAAARSRSWTVACPSRRRSPAWPWGSSGRATRYASSPTSSVTRTTSATWTSRSRARRRASPPCRWTSR